MIVIGISGISGFVGTNLRKYLQGSGHHLIKAIDLRSSSELCFDNEEIIIHLAGKAHDLKSISDPSEYYKINFELTKSLYDTFVKSKASKFIFISSVKAVADEVDGVLYESKSPSPKTHYGKSKWMAEEYINSVSLPEGKSCYILRPCMIHGPGNKGNLNLLYKFVKRGIPYPLGKFENKRSFLSVENLCFIIKELTERDIASGTYNVADDEPLSTNEVINLLGQAISHEPRILRIPVMLINLLAKVGTVLKLPLNTSNLQKLTSNYVVSNKKIKDILKKTLPLDVRDGILETARSFKNV